MSMEFHMFRVSMYFCLTRLSQIQHQNGNSCNVNYYLLLNLLIGSLEPVVYICTYLTYASPSSWRLYKREDTYVALSEINGSVLNFIFAQ